MTNGGLLGGRGLGLREAATPILDSITGGLSSARRGIRQATQGLSLPAIREARENIRAGLTAGNAQQAAEQAAARRQMSFQSREFVEKADVGPARPVETTRIRIDTGL